MEKFDEIGDVPQGLVDRLKALLSQLQTTADRTGACRKKLPCANDFSDKKKRVEIIDVYDRAEALDVITRSLRDYKNEVSH